MSNLISSNNYRLRRSGAFYLCAALAAVVGTVIFFLLNWTDIKNNDAGDVETAVFSASAAVGIVTAVSVSLFTGADYQDGALRLKLASGTSRTSVYLAALVPSLIVGAVSVTTALLPGTALGYILFGGFHTMKAGTAASLILGVYFMGAAYSALSTMIAMLISNRAWCGAVSMIVAVGLLALGAAINGMLEQGPTVLGMQMTVNGELTSFSQIPNPNYIPDGPLRAFLTLVNDVLPGGQSVNYAALKVTRPALLIVYDLAVSLLATAAGIAVFRRKDIR